jgi:hypothetical protein
MKTYREILEIAKLVDWVDFYKMAKDKSGKTLKAFEKKYGSVMDRPHIKDALDKTDDFKSFMKFIAPFENVSK